MGVADSKKIWGFVIIRVLLIFAIIASFLEQRWVNLIISLFTLIIINLPSLSKEKQAHENPGFIEYSIVAFIFLSMYLSRALFFIDNLWWIESFLRFILSIILVLIGFFLVYITNRQKRAIMALNPSFVALFSLVFAISAALGWEVLKFLLDYFFNTNLHTTDVNFVMWNLIIYSLGALMASVLGYLHLKYFEYSFVRKIIISFVKKHPTLFSSVATPEDYVKEIIKSGEGETIEFKSSIRTNLYTQQHDTRIEHSLLKTIVAFLNSKGGIVLLGVNDSGELIGLEQDRFKSHDKMKLHVITLIKKHIGDNHSSSIDFETITINEKTVFRIICNKSKKQVFLNTGLEEEFYIRAGPSSIKLTGSKLIDYVKERFK